MNLLIILLLGAASIWLAFKIYTFFSEIGAASFDDNLPDSWTVIESDEKKSSHEKDVVKISYSSDIDKAADIKSSCLSINS
jgi:hypothetical protein